jgi:transposase
VATATVYTLRHLALRIQNLTVEERQLQQQITAVLNTGAPQPLQRHGVGPDSAAALLITAGDNPDRIERRSLLRHLCGSAPSKRPPAKPADAGSTAPATAAPTPPSTASP